MLNTEKWQLFRHFRHKQRMRPNHPLDRLVVAAFELQRQQCDEGPGAGAERHAALLLGFAESRWAAGAWAFAAALGFVTHCTSR